MSPGIIEKLVEVLKLVLRKAVKETTTTMMNVELKETQNAPPPTYDIVSTIGFSGPHIGNFVMCMSKRAGLDITANMLGLDNDRESEECMADCLGEVNNIIAGQMKAIMIEKGITFSLSLPNVIIGNGMSIPMNKNLPNVLLLNYQLGNEIISMNVTLK